LKVGVRLEAFKDLLSHIFSVFVIVFIINVDATTVPLQCQIL
jgi:hypothetical protein